MQKRKIKLCLICLCASMCVLSGCGGNTETETANDNVYSSTPSVSSVVSSENTVSSAAPVESSAKEESTKKAESSEEKNVIYANKVQVYNNKTYYTPNFAHVNLSGKIDMSGLGYTALPTFSDKQMDFFVIDNDTIYFTDEASGTDRNRYPAKLYKCKLDGSELKLIEENVDAEFVLENGIIKYSISDSDLFKYYHTDSGKIEKGSDDDWFMYYNPSNLIYAPMTEYGENNAVVYMDGKYYILVNLNSHENLEFYRKDTKTGKALLIGKGFSPQINVTPDNISDTQSTIEESSQLTNVVTEPSKQNGDIQVSKKQESSVQVSIEAYDEAPEGFSEYAEIVRSLIKDYGRASIVENYSALAGPYQLKGLCYANIMDFDNDGTDELICVYGPTTNGNGFDTPFYMKVYGYDGKNVKTLFENSAFFFNEYENSSYFFNEKRSNYSIAYCEENNGILLLTRKNPMTYTIFEWSRLTNNGFEIVKSFSDFDEQNPGVVCKIDGAKVSREEFNKQLNEYLNKQTYVYLAYDSKSYLEETINITNDTLELLGIN